MNRLTLIIPVFNEAGNLLPLATDLEKTQARKAGVEQVLWVDNGSTDKSSHQIEYICARYPWSQSIRLETNLGYGGGIRAGVLAAAAESTHIGWIPADGQVSATDVLNIWSSAQQTPEAVHKGLRVKRADVFSKRLISKIYSLLTRIVLRMPVQDTNGLPKIFPAVLLRRIAEGLAPKTGFSFDAETLYAAYRSRIEIYEHPVIFHSRQLGNSSWATLQWKTYLNVLKALFELRQKQFR